MKQASLHNGRPGPIDQDLPIKTPSGQYEKIHNGLFFVLFETNKQVSTTVTYDADVRISESHRESELGHRDSRRVKFSGLCTTSQARVREGTGVGEEKRRTEGAKLFWIKYKYI